MSNLGFQLFASICRNGREMLREAKTATLLGTSTGIFVVRLWLLDVFFFRWRL